VLGIREVRAGRRRTGPLLAMGASAVGVLLVCAWPTWARLPGSIETAQAIASTANPGNLHRPLRVAQALGTWLDGSYVVEPSGIALYLTYVAVGFAVLALLIGAWRLVSRERVLFAWILLMLAVWLVLRESASTWADAKTLMLTSPVVLLVCWAGVAAMRASRARTAAFGLALVLSAGVLVSDAIQYHASNLAPTARYDELASLDARYAGHGPALFTDYDEYALYDLHDLDVGGPNFIYPPPALAGIVPHNGYPVDLDRIPPARFAAYPLIINRRNPAASRPPSAYRLLWRGTYYEVWGRRAGAVPAIVHFGLSGGRPVSCASVQSVERAGLAWLRAQHDTARGVRLVAAGAPEIVRVSAVHARHSRNWTAGRVGLLMSGAGGLTTHFALPHAGGWTLWLEGQLMPAVTVAVDGRRVATLSGQVGGTSVTQQVMTPIALRLSAGGHTLTVLRASAGLRPGGAGWADLRSIFLTPAGAGSEATLHEANAAAWRSLCAQPLQWVEALPV